MPSKTPRRDYEDAKKAVADKHAGKGARPDSKSYSDLVNDLRASAAPKP
jgi:hypothetical protein